MLNFSYSLFVGTLLQGLLLAVSGGQAGLSMGGGMGFEYADIKVGSLEPTAPQPIGSDVQTCTILSIRCGSSKGFPSYWLQIRFNTNIITNFS